MSFNDLEFLVLLVLALILFVTGLKKKDAPSLEKYIGIDLPMSSALKGIACVFILMGHYVGKRIGVVDVTFFSKAIHVTTANIALAIFMYFSGYGLSLKKHNPDVKIVPIWFNRMKKVYLPLFYTCLMMLLLFVIIPEKFSVTEAGVLGVSKDINLLHHFKIEYLGTLISHLFGWKDWYVFCIMFFYSFFYLSQSLTRNKPANQTWVLWLMMVAYYAFAYFFFGLAEAHWYRYCWVFFLGHVHAKMVQSGEINKMDVLMLAVISLTILLEPMEMKFSWLIAIVIIVVGSRLNRYFSMNSKVLAFMGSISFFFYLSHTRIGYTLMAYTNIYSVLLWVAITATLSYILLKTYNYIAGQKRVK